MEVKNSFVKNGRVFLEVMGIPDRLGKVIWVHIWND